MSASPWTLDKHEAQLALGPLCARIDLRDPAGGFQETRLDGAPLRANLLGVLLAPHVDTLPADAYVRGPDLVVTYPQSIGRAMRVQAYWRCEAQPASLAVELQVSVQTDALGIATPVIASSQLETVEVLRLKSSPDATFSSLSLNPGPLTQLVPQDGPGCLLFHPPAQAWCYAEMIHSADFQQDQLTLQASQGQLRATLEHRLFPGTLEKGVILRARIRGLFVHENAASQEVPADYHNFLRAPLPLTT
jgi:hypothetical protein